MGIKIENCLKMWTFLGSGTINCHNSSHTSACFINLNYYLAIRSGHQKGRVVSSEENKVVVKEQGNCWLDSEQVASIILWKWQNYSLYNLR